jgi:mycothiol synthase
MSDSPRSVPDWVTRLAARSQSTDGAPPFSDGAVVDYRLGERELVTIDHDAAALASEGEMEFVVDPDARGRGIGAQMLETLLLRSNAARFWAHGDHPAARALARSHGLAAVRELLHLTTELPVSARSSGHTRVTSQIDHFVVGTDEDEWVALNALIFEAHPEQGSVTRADVEELESEPWFRADDFLLLRRENRMIGYCWLKVEGDRGEFYVVGVSPDHQGEHLGSLLFEAGLARLRELGIRTAHLYVEGDNEPALRLYRSRGFEQDAIDIQYAAR